jgi:hypothetical protein
MTDAMCPTCGDPLDPDDGRCLYCDLTRRVEAGGPPAPAAAAPFPGGGGTTPPTPPVSEPGGTTDVGMTAPDAELSTEALFFEPLAGPASDRGRAATPTRSQPAPSRPATPVPPPPPPLRSTAPPIPNRPPPAARGGCLRFVLVLAVLGGIAWAAVAVYPNVAGLIGGARTTAKPLPTDGPCPARVLQAMPSPSPADVVAAYRTPNHQVIVVCQLRSGGGFYYYGEWEDRREPGFAAPARPTGVGFAAENGAYGYLTHDNQEVIITQSGREIDREALTPVSGSSVQ